MGRGIALAFAYGGHEIAVVDLKQRPAADFDRLARRGPRGDGIEPAHARRAGRHAGGGRGQGAWRASTWCRQAQAAEVLAQAEVVFEGVPETLEAKREAFARICALAAPEAILASTTSTILVSDLAPLATHPERVVNAHWLNPAYIIPLVELSAHAGTAPAVIARLRALLEDIGKVPVLCGPAPGYIVPRLQALIMNEAARMVEEGVATAEDIDKATRYGLGLRFAAMGVIEFIDFGGNDILYYASRYLSERLSRERYTAPAIVDRLMHEGRIGLKTGEGFYDYRDRDVSAYRKDVLARTLGMLKHVGLHRPPR